MEAFCEEGVRVTVRVKLAAIEAMVVRCVGEEGKAREADVVRVRGTFGRRILDGHVDVVALAIAVVRAVEARGVGVVTGVVVRALGG